MLLMLHTGGATQEEFSLYKKFKSNELTATQRGERTATQCVGCAVVELINYK